MPRQSAEFGGTMPLPLTTPRLVLRRLKPSDWKDLFEIMSDEEVFRYLDGYPMDEEQISHWLEADADVRLTHPGQSLFLGMERRDSGKLIGHVSLSYRDEGHRQAEVNMLLRRDHETEGYGEEALRALLILGFSGLDLHRVVAHCDSRNLACCRMLEAAGLRREGEFRQNHFLKGEWANTVWYALLHEEWAAQSRTA